MKTIIALLALSSSLFAAETRQVEVSFYCLKYVRGLETIHVPQDEVREPVRLSTANLTNPVRVTAVDGVIPIYQKEGNAPDIAGRVSVPAGVDKALVVLVPSGKDATSPYHALVMDRGEKFRLGTYRVINFSHRPIRGAIGRSYIETVAGGTSDLELQGAPGTVQGVRFEFLNEGRWNRLTETRCAVRKDRRWLLCVYQDPETDRIHMRSIPDRTTLLVNASAGGGDEAATAAN